MSKRSIRDWMLNAFVARDKASVDKLIRDAEENGNGHDEPDGDEGDDNRSVHVHVHQHQAGENGDNGDDGDNKSTDDKKLGDRVAKLEDGLKALDTKLGKVLDAVKGKAKDKDDDKDDDKTDDEGNPFAKKDDDDKKTDDEDKDDDKDKDTDDELPDTTSQTAKTLGSAGPELMEADPALKTGESRMGDAAWQARASSAMRKLIVDTKARAEVIAPGMKVPSYDRAMSFKDAGDSVCTLRRAALAKALTTDSGKKMMRHLTADGLKHMSCKTVRMIFLDASDRMRDANNAAMAAGAGYSGTFMGEPRSAFDAQAAKLKSINERNAEFWAHQSGRAVH